MRFDPDFRPFVAPKCIYIVPLSQDPSRFQVLIPNNLSKRLLDLLIQDKLVIRQFRDCSDQAAANVKAQLGSSCSRGLSRYSNRMNQFIVVGSALLVLGIINVVAQDPLILIDEILMIGGGTGIGLAGYLSRRRNLPLLRGKTEKAVQRLASLAAAVDPLLTCIHQAICTLSAPESGTAQDETMDPVELESKWLVENLNLDSLFETGAVSSADLESLLDALTSAFPLSRFLSVERKLRQDPGNSRIRRQRNKLAGDYGLSAEAFTVYAEFYRLAGQILSGGA
jgi:hypothetical protein